MTRGATTLIALLSIAACAKTPQSSAETSAASSTDPAVAPSTVTGSAQAIPVTSRSASQSPTVKGGRNGSTTKATSRASSRSGINQPTDPNILGRDSVIRRKVRGLPTASSTSPIR
jgi:hypothetical protein